MTMTMTMTNLTEHILSPLIRGGSKAGIYFSRLAARNHTNPNKLNKIIRTQSHRDTKFFKTVISLPLRLPSF